MDTATQVDSHSLADAAAASRAAPAPGYSARPSPPHIGLTKQDVDIIIALFHTAAQRGLVSPEDMTEVGTTFAKIKSLKNRADEKTAADAQDKTQ